VVVGRDEPGDWLLLDDGCWVVAGAVEVKGDIEALPIAESPLPSGQ